MLCCFFRVKKAVHHFDVWAREDVLLDIISGFLEAHAWSPTCFITRIVHDSSSADLSGNGLQSRNTPNQFLIVRSPQSPQDGSNALMTNFWYSGAWKLPSHHFALIGSSWGDHADEAFKLYQVLEPLHVWKLLARETAAFLKSSSSTVHALAML